MIFESAPNIKRRIKITFGLTNDEIDCIYPIRSGFSSATIQMGQQKNKNKGNERREKRFEIM